MPEVFISAGEASGDFLAGALAVEMKKINPALNFFGLGGPSLRAAGTRTFYAINELGVVGFWEVAKKLPFFRRVFSIVETELKKRKPDLVLLVDYPGMNLRLAKLAKSLGLKVGYFISPQFWAWKESRVEAVKKYVDKMVVIFPFEVEFYKKHGIEAEWYGHPFLDLVRPETSKEDFFKLNNLDPRFPLLSFFPGSRIQQLEKHLPLIFKTLTRLKQDGLKFQSAWGLAPGLSKELAAASLPKAYEPEVRLVDRHRYGLMSASDFALSSVGTVTLELALLQTPFLIFYKTSPLTYFFAKRWVKLPYVGLVNLVAGKKIVPEFLQSEAQPDKLAEAAYFYLKEPLLSGRLKEKLAGVREKLGRPGALPQIAASFCRLV
ncbi:MAG: lipid-A-disaccharide synthase [candidate division Zixibacteria bacterium]|nr:lipid-A-disaccharide synthase [candidate division Zixibacteria bacterium]